jgi:hypothetical protein
VVKRFWVVFDMVDKDYPVGMVNLMLENARQKALGGYPKLLAV